VLKMKLTSEKADGPGDAFRRGDGGNHELAENKRADSEEEEDGCWKVGPAHSMGDRKHKYEESSADKH
jgi:hypothetical protein